MPFGDCRLSRQSPFLCPRVAGDRRSRYRTGRPFDRRRERSSTRRADDSRPFSSRDRHPKTHIRWHIRSYIPYMPLPITETVENTTLPRQFACSIEPDPMRFLLPIGHQRATRPAYRTALRETALGRALSREPRRTGAGTRLQLPIGSSSHASPRATAGRPTPTEARTRRTNTRHGTAASRCARTP